MLDHHLVLSQPDDVARRLGRRHLDVAELSPVLAAVRARQASIGALEALRRQMNSAAQQVAQLARAGHGADIEQRRGALQALKARIKVAQEAEAAAEERFAQALAQLPNLPDPQVPDGAGAEDNPVVASWGQPGPAGANLPHWQLGEQLGELDFPRAAKLSGARFAVLRGQLARLSRALATLMLQLAEAHGYVEHALPLLVLPEAMFAAGQYPKFRGDAFATEGHEHVLVPTAEVPLVNLYRDEVLPAAALPLCLSAHTPCFRRESGAAGRDSRGLIRLHQFDKVELVSITTAEHSAGQLMAMRGHAEAVLRALQLPYRVVELCAGDLGFAAARTFDLEVWLPGQQAFREISSVSSCGDFQARRAQIRVRPPSEGKGGRLQLAHTLNGSALAVGRTLVAVLENGQQADGSVQLPEALWPLMGCERLLPAS